MSAETRRGWIEAGKILADDPAAKVICPACAGEFLQVEDIVHPDGTLLDRHIRCDICGEQEVLVRLRRKAD